MNENIDIEFLAKIVDLFHPSVIYEYIHMVSFFYLSFVVPTVSCGITFNKLYYDGAAKSEGSEYIKRTKTIHLIDSLDTISIEQYREETDIAEKEKVQCMFEKHGNIKEVAILTLNENTIQNLKHNAYKYFKVEDLLEIKNTTARKLFIMLTKWRYWEKKNTFRRKANFLASRIPLSWKASNIGGTIRILLNACEYLRKRRKISNYRFIKGSKLKDGLIEFEFKKQDSLFVHNNMVGAGTTGHEGLEIVEIAENIADNNPIDLTPEKDEESDIVDVIADLFPEEFKKSKSLKLLINEYVFLKGVEYVKNNIEYVNSKKIQLNGYSGYLAGALEHNWGENYTTTNANKNIIVPGTTVELDGKRYVFDDQLKIYNDLWKNKFMDAHFFKVLLRSSPQTTKIVSQGNRNMV